MVQSSRLKKVNPLTPIFVILVLTVLIFILLFPRINSIVLHNVNKYENERTTIINEYNSIVIETTESKELIVLKSDLEENKRLVEKRLVLLSKLNDLNNKYLKYNNQQINILIQGYRLNDENINEYNLNLLNSIEQKISAIITYNLLKDVSTCIKSISKNYTIDECKIFVNSLNQNSEIYSKSNSFLNSYTTLKQTDRNKRINEIITLINKEIVNLEKLINKNIY